MRQMRLPPYLLAYILPVVAVAALLGLLLKNPAWALSIL